jgi:hypothetical protein
MIFTREQWPGFKTASLYDQEPERNECLLADTAKLRYNNIDFAPFY